MPDIQINIRHYIVRSIVFVLRCCIVDLSLLSKSM